MTEITATTVPTDSTATKRADSLRRTTLKSGLVAAAATTALAGVANAAGVSLEIEGEMIPLLGFAQMTLLGAIIGGVILAVMNRRSRHAQATFTRTAVALTALSCVPSVMWPDDLATKAVLVATHVLAAVMIVPALNRHARS